MRVYIVLVKYNFSKISFCLVNTQIMRENLFPCKMGCHRSLKSPVLLQIFTRSQNDTRKLTGAVSFYLKNSKALKCRKLSNNYLTSSDWLPFSMSHHNWGKPAFSPDLKHKVKYLGYGRSA